MTVELHVNGMLTLELQPDTPIERAILDEMASGATRGKKVAMALREADGAVLISVETK